ncbi:unnamed protein product [Alopecurus aequalis]
MSVARDEGKKGTPEDQAEAEVHQAFRRSANALSQLYTSSVANQKASFLAGERRAMESVYQWISSQNEEASLSVSDVLAYVQDEIERRGGMAGSPQHPSPQPASCSPSADVQTSTFSFAAALDSQQWQPDRPGTAGIPNALPSPLQQNIYPCYPVQWSECGPVDSPTSNHSPPTQESMQGESSEHSSDMDHDAP